MTPYQNLKTASDDFTKVKFLVGLRQNATDNESAISIENELESILNRHRESIALPMINSLWESKSTQYANGMSFTKGDCVTVMAINIAKDIHLTLKSDFGEFGMSWKQFQIKFRELI